MAVQEIRATGGQRRGIKGTYGNLDLMVSVGSPEKIIITAEDVIVRTLKMTSDIIDQMPSLKIIAEHGVGVLIISISLMPKAKESGQLILLIRK